jgi:hypothetical protein
MAGETTDWGFRVKTDECVLELCEISGRQNKLPKDFTALTPTRRTATLSIPASRAERVLKQSLDMLEKC